MNYSVRTVKPPEFINLQATDVSPLIASCDIKVLYVGENRNRTSISKATASEMAKTLRGSMIVGYYKKDKEDFADHGQVVTIDDEGVHFECKTTPYGFVAPDAKVWFQTFEEQNEAGDIIEREYLMTNGFLWTKAFPEAAKVIEEGRPQSMELDKDSVRGTWTNSVKNNYEILIINDAVFSKLCILGEDVEPCFEGASVTKPEILSYSLDNEFKNTVYTMMQELQQLQQGGKAQMDMENTTLNNTPVTEPGAATEYAKDDEKDKKEGNTAASGGNASADKEEKGDAPAAKEDGGNAEDSKEDEDKKKKKDDYSLNSVSLDEYNKLKSQYSALEKTVAELTKFKAEAEREKKTALINKFVMLTDEEKSDVVTNIDKYTLDEIESTLSVKCFRKGTFVSSTSENSDSTVEIKDDPITTYSLAGVASGVTQQDAWIKAVEQNKV